MAKFALFTLFLALILLLCGCPAESRRAGNGSENVKISGDIKSETRKLSGFNKIHASSAVTVEISLQKEFSVVVETNGDLLQYVLTATVGDSLKITTKDRISLQDSEKIKVKISMPELVILELSGASRAIVSDAKTESVRLTANGMSKIAISGEVNKLKARANGASEIDAENLKTETAEVDANGASNVTVSPLNELNAKANGESTIAYTGEPKKINQETSGLGSIKKK